MSRRALLLSALLLGGCSSSTAATAGGTDGAAGDASAEAAAADAVGDETPGGADGAVAEMRGLRYCEILVATLASTNVHVQVFTTEGLSDCPADAWSKIDADAIKADLGATAVIPNGPRYWTLDSLRGSTLIDPTVRTFGTLQMRQAGAIDVPAASASTMQAPYAQHTIQRSSVFTWSAGGMVYELVGPDGHVYTMQSYSVQKVTTQTEATLPSLGASLMLPTGWSFRTRTLTADLVASATAGKATVIQDDDANTYSLTK